MLNKFDSPISEGVYRALLNAVATLIVVTLTTYQGMDMLDMARYDRWEKALIAGVIAALTPFVTGSLIAKSDQNRAEKSQVKDADVPVAAVRG